LYAVVDFELQGSGEGLRRVCEGMRIERGGYERSVWEVGMRGGYERRV
jgi:hypothetical protein